MSRRAQVSRSLLPAGITRVEGSFKPGDAIAIAAPDGHIIGRGLSNFAAADVDKIKGKKTAEARLLMGGQSYDEVVHRDNLVIGHEH